MQSDWLYLSLKNPKENKYTRKFVEILIRYFMKNIVNTLYILTQCSVSVKSHREEPKEIQVASTWYKETQQIAASHSGNNLVFS